MNNAVRLDTSSMISKKQSKKTERELYNYMKKRRKQLLEIKRTTKIDNSIIDLKLKMIKGSKKRKSNKKRYTKKQFNVLESTSESDEMDQVPYVKKPLNKHFQSVLVSTPKVLKTCVKGNF